MAPNSSTDTAAASSARVGDAAVYFAIFLLLLMSIRSHMRYEIRCRLVTFVLTLIVPFLSISSARPSLLSLVGSVVTLRSALVRRCRLAGPWIDSAGTSDRHVHRVVRTRIYKTVRLSKTAASGVSACLPLPHNVHVGSDKRKSESPFSVQRPRCALQFPVAERCAFHDKTGLKILELVNILSAGHPNRKIRKLECASGALHTEGA